MPTKVLQFPDLGNIFLNQLPATLGNGRDYIGGNPTKILTISVILLIMCGQDSIIRSFRLI